MNNDLFDDLNEAVRLWNEVMLKLRDQNDAELTLACQNMSAHLTTMLQAAAGQYDDE